MNKRIWVVYFFALHGKQIRSFIFWEILRRAQTAFGFIWPLDSVYLEALLHIYNENTFDWFDFEQENLEKKKGPSVCKRQNTDCAKVQKKAILFLDSNARRDVVFSENDIIICRNHFFYID